MSNFGQAGIMRSNQPLFTVKCEKIGKRAWYKVSFSPNNQINERIKLSSKDHHKWSLEDHCWHLHTRALYDLVKSYRKSDKIRFEFGENGRLEFLEQIKKLDQLLEEKQDKIEKLKKKNNEALAWKKELEENFAKYEPEVLKYLKPDIKLYPHQVVAIMFLKKVINGLLSLEMGLGKAEKLDSKLLTPNGWITMGEVKLGDQIIGSNGKPTTVIGVFPQGKKDIYKVWFNDNTCVECCDEHLWSVNSPTRMWRNKINYKYPNRILTLRQIMNEGLTIKNGNRKHYIPIVEPIEFEEKKLLIHPYILGTILGDGSISGKYGISIATNDVESINYLSEFMHSGNTIQKIPSSKYSYSITTKTKENYFNKELKSLNLRRSNSYTKFIPHDYKFGSIKQRLELLQGLLDTDGHIFKDGSHIEITLASKQLIDDLQFVVQSLGGIGRIKDKWVTYNGERRRYYRMGVKLPPQFIPFKLSRKVERYKPVTKYLPSRAISKIEYIGKHEAQCIAVDAPDHLYVTDNCIVTHNTLCSIGYAEMMGFKKVLVIVPNSLKYNYFDEVEKFTRSSKPYIIKAKNNKYKQDDANYVIVNYDYFNNKDHKKVKAKFDALNLGFIEAVVLDESHMIKNTQSNTYKNIKKLIKDIPSKVFLSGTPAPNRTKELYTVLNLISPLDFPTKSEFYEMYCGLTYVPKIKTDDPEEDDGHYGGWKQNEGGMRLEELYHKIAPYTYRKRKFEVLKDLPDKIYQKIMIEMTEDQQAQYEKIEEGVANEIFSDQEMSNVNILTIMLRLRQYTSMLKIVPTVDLAKRLMEEGEKSVIVDMFKPPILGMKKLIGDAGGLHTGDEDQEERNIVKNDFMNPDGECKIFLASISTTKYGLTLTAASKLFMTTLPWSTGEYDQVSDRLHRIGQKDTVFIYPVIIKDTIDEYVFRMIEKKRIEITKVLDNEDYESNVEESVLSEILAMLKLKYGKKKDGDGEKTT
jgi:hypothetical protein